MVTGEPTATSADVEELLTVELFTRFEAVATAFAVRLFTTDLPVLSFTYARILNVPSALGVKEPVLPEPNVFHVSEVDLLYWKV